MRKAVMILILIPLLSLLGSTGGAQEMEGSDMILPMGDYSDLSGEQLGDDWGLDGSIIRESYVLGPGDRLLLILEGSSIKRIPLRILPEGILSWSGGLHLPVIGLTLSQAEERVIEALASLLVDVKINLLLLVPRRIEVYVLGEVKRPGPVSLRASDRIFRAIQKAGGPSARGSNRYVDLKGSGIEDQRLDLYPFRFEGDWSANPYCPPGMIIYVPLRYDSVQVVGEVRRPGAFEWSPGETMKDYLRYAGGMTLDAIPSSVLIERDETKVEMHFTSFAETGQLMRPGDVIVVGSRKPLMKRVFLEGAGERRGEIYLSESETLGDLVQRLGDTRGQALPDQTILERKGTDRNEFIRLDLQALLRGEGPVNMLVENDDVLYVPVRQQQVFILGHVNNPGPQPYQPSMTVGQYLAIAGGVSERGSNNQVKVIDIYGDEHDIAPGDHLHRGDVLVVGKSRWLILTEVLLAAATLGGLILSINALAK